MSKEIQPGRQRKITQISIDVNLSALTLPWVLNTLSFFKNKTPVARGT